MSYWQHECCLLAMAKLTITDLLKSKKVIPASELKAQKESEALALKLFDDAVIEQSRNQRFQSPKKVGSITRPFRRESVEE